MKMPWSKLCWSVGALGLGVVLVYGGFLVLGGSPLSDNRVLAQQVPSLPSPSGLKKTAPRAPDNALSNALGSRSDAEIWRQVRRGIRGKVPIQDLKAGVLVQSEGDNWRSFRNGPVVTYGWWGLAGTVALLALFFAYRGRIRISAGPSGRRIERFTVFERSVHWLTAGSFVVLALTGLNMLYGRYLFAMDPAGDAGDFTAMHTAFAAIAYYGKFVHNYIGFAFAVGVVLMIVIWLRHNLPNRHDLIWLAKAGGMLVKGVHPPARKFNAGQKIIFWAVVFGGFSLTWSGLALIFPYQITPFSDTFAVLNLIGLDLPTDLAPLQEMQLMQIWHAIASLLMIALIIAHIYIGTLGMEGAFDAMNSGLVDENWAKEHHDLWVAELEGKSGSGGGGKAVQPGE